MTNATKKTAKKVGGEEIVLADIAAMPESDRVLAQHIHKIVKEIAPSLTPRLWYGMPGYTKDGKIVCFFQSAHKFKTRYASLSFMHDANLDEGNMWPVSFALTKISSAEEKKISALVKKAAS